MQTSIEKNTGDHLIYQVGHSFYKEEEKKHIDQKGNKWTDFFLCKNLQFRQAEKKHFVFKEKVPKV